MRQKRQKNRKLHRGTISDYKCHTKGCDETPNRQDLSAHRPL
jgi:hypothetical protein